MMELETIQQDIAALPPDAQQIIFDLVEILKKRYIPDLKETSQIQGEEWSDFIGCVQAEPDLSSNYKTYIVGTAEMGQHIADAVAQELSKN